LSVARLSPLVLTRGRYRADNDFVFAFLSPKLARRLVPFRSPNPIIVFLALAAARAHFPATPRNLGPRPAPGARVDIQQREISLPCVALPDRESIFFAFSFFTSGRPRIFFSPVDFPFSEVFGEVEPG